MNNSELKEQLINNLFATPTSAKHLRKSLEVYAGALSPVDNIAYWTALGMLSNYIASQIETEPQALDNPILTDLANYIDELQGAATQIKRTIQDLQSC